jgi:hypothetical protein
VSPRTGNQRGLRIGVATSVTNLRFCHSSEPRQGDRAGHGHDLRLGVVSVVENGHPLYDPESDYIGEARCWVHGDPEYANTMFNGSTVVLVSIHRHGSKNICTENVGVIGESASGPGNKFE